MKKLEKINLKIPAWASIISAILIIPAAILGIVVVLRPDISLLNSIVTFTSLIFLVTSILVLLGYLRIAKENKQKFLETILYISFIVLVASSLMTFFKGNFPASIHILSNAILGLTEIALSIAILKLRKIYGGIIIAIGVLNIISTLFALTVILFFFGILTNIAVNILQTIFFFQISKKYDSGVKHKNE